MLTLILGPMYSGKSAELIARAEPFRVAKKTVQFIQPHIDTRNDGIQSRIGTRADALVVSDLGEAPEADVYAIDEFHMLPADSHRTIRKWLDKGREVFIATLDTTYDGTVFPPIVNLLSLKPDKIVLKLAVCMVCFEYAAKYTQILNWEDQPLTAGLPSDLTEDGRYKYEARCRRCFVRG